MPGPNLIQSVGGRTQKETKFVPITTGRSFNGLVTNRSLLRGPLSTLYTDFYHMGQTDVLCDGLNSEVSTRLTMIRRPGNPPYCVATIASIPDSSYSFHHNDGTLELVLDTAADMRLVTPATNNLLFTKSSGAGEGYFQGVNNWLYMSDGIGSDMVKYIPGVLNPVNQFGLGVNQPVWAWGGAAPTTAPTLTFTATSSGVGVAWAASVTYSTMGLMVDPVTNSIQVLTSVTQNGNTGNTGASATAQPPFAAHTTWANICAPPLTDGSCHWFQQNGPITLWAKSKSYPANSVIFVPGVGGTPVPATQGTGLQYLRGTPFNGTTGGGIWVAFYGGTSGVNQPNWNHISNGNTPDGSVVWQYVGPATAWQPSTEYGAWWEWCVCQIVYPAAPTVAGIQAGNKYYVFANNMAGCPGMAAAGSTSNPGTSASGGAYNTPFSATAGTIVDDGQLQWVSLGNKSWIAGISYTAWTQGSSSFGAIVDAVGNFQVCMKTGISGSTVPYGYWQASTVYASNQIIAVPNPSVGTGLTLMQVTGGGGGSSGSSAPSWNFNNGQTTLDGALTWTSQGVSTAGIPMFGNAYGNLLNGGGTNGGGVLDGTVNWVNVGTAANSNWAANQKWYMPSSGFLAPTPTTPFGGTVVQGSGFNQFCIGSGLSQNPGPPSWNAAVNNNTTDNKVTWFSASTSTTQGFTWTKGYGYCYAYKARTTSDLINTQAPPMWPSLITATNGSWTYGQPGFNTVNATPPGCQDGGVTTASPVAQLLSANSAGGNVTVTGPSSLDPQFDTVIVFRSADGYASSGPYLYLTEIPMPTNGQQWKIIDYMSDTASASLPGLNPLIIAPIAHVNDPPPGQAGSLITGVLLGTTYHQGRLWGFVGNTVYASGGPSTNPGNGFTAWPPTQAFPFQSNVMRLLPHTAGLLVFTTSDLYLIGGGPSITTYYSQLLVPGLSLLSWNALTTLRGVPHLFTGDRQFLSLDANTGLTRIGHKIGDKLQTFDPTKVYVTYHSFGDLDHALFVGDGSTGWYRCDPNMAPDGDISGPVWSPFAQVNGGNIKMINSTETSPGNFTLLVGDSRGGQLLLARSSAYTSFVDNVSPYDAYFTMGNIMLVNPGQIAEMAFIEMDFIQIGSQPTVQVLLDEISATNGAAFETISNSFVSDPPKLYGPTATPATLWANRYYFGQTIPGNAGNVPAPAWCRHLQIKVDFGSVDKVQNEMLEFTIFGSVWQEK